MTALVLTIMRPGAEAETREVAYAGFSELRPLLRELLGGGAPEHVAVLHDGQRADMFVDEDSVAKGLARNGAASAVYRCNTLTREPGTDPENLPAIYGAAILCSRRVWF